MIPSSKEKVIQSEFNGRLVEIKVKLGDKLKKNDLVARVSDEEILEDRKTSNEDFLRAKALLLELNLLRQLKLPAFDSKFVKDELETRADIALEQIEIAQTTLDSYNKELLLINNQRDQISQKIKDSKSELISIRESVKLVQDEKQIIEPMVKKGYEPKLSYSILQNYKIQKQKKQNCKIRYLY